MGTSWFLLAISEGPQMMLASWTVPVDVVSRSMTSCVWMTFTLSRVGDSIMCESVSKGEVVREN